AGDPRRPVGPPRAPPSQKALASATLDATAPVTLGAGHPIVSAAAPRGGAAARPLRSGRAHRGEAGPARVAEQYGVHGQAEPGLAPACGGARPARPYLGYPCNPAAAATGLVPGVP